MRRGQAKPGQATRAFAAVAAVASVVAIEDTGAGQGLGLTETPHNPAASSHLRPRSPATDPD